MSFSVFVITVLVFAGLLWFVLPFALRRLESHRLATLCARRKAIVLTYDDGPSPSISPELSELLSARGVPATFFLLGTHAEKHPELVHRLQEDGHEIGSHTHDHSNAWKTTPWYALRDIHKGRWTLKEIIGVPTQLFRPPFGKTTLASLFYGFRHRLRFSYWTVDSRDSWDRRPVEDVLAMVKAQGGGVVLMHDFSAPRRGPNPAAHHDYVLELTSALIEFADRNGFTCMRFGDLFSPSSLEATP